MVVAPNPDTQISLMLIEAGLTAIAVGIAFAMPRIGASWFSAIERSFKGIARRKGLSVALVLIWLFVNCKNFSPRLLNWIPVSADLLTYGLALATIVVALTLPQAILLWTEPDMAELEPEEEMGL